MPIIVPSLERVGSYPVCPACRGFQYLQVEPGRFVVCDCGGSGLDGLAGDMTPGAVVRNSQMARDETLFEKQGRRQRENTERAV